MSKPVKVTTCVTYSVQLHPASQPINITISRSEKVGGFSSDSRHLLETPVHRHADLPSPMRKGQNSFDAAIADVVKHLESVVV